MWEWTSRSSTTESSAVALLWTIFSLLIDTSAQSHSEPLMPLEVLLSKLYALHTKFAMAVYASHEVLLSTGHVTAAHWPDTSMKSTCQCSFGM